MRLTYRALANQLNSELFLRMSVETLEVTLGQLCRTVRAEGYTTKEAKELLVRFAEEEPEMTTLLIQTAYEFPQYTNSLCRDFRSIHHIVRPQLMPTDVLATEVFSQLGVLRVGFTEEELEGMFDNLIPNLIRGGLQYFAVEEVLMTQARTSPDNFGMFLQRLNAEPDQGVHLYYLLVNGEVFIDDFAASIEVLENLTQQMNDIVSHYDIEDENVITLDITETACHNNNIENNGATEMTTTTAVRTDERILTALSATVENIQAFDETMSVGQLYRSMWRLYYCAANQIFPNFQAMVELHQASRVTIIGQIMTEYRDTDELDIFVGIIQSLDFISLDLGQRDTLVNLLTYLTEYEEVDYQEVGQSFYNTIREMIRQTTISHFDMIAEGLVDQTWELLGERIHRGVTNTVYSIMFHYHAQSYLTEYLDPHFSLNVPMLDVLDDEDLISTLRISARLVSLSDRSELVSFVRMVQHIPNYYAMFTDISENLPDFLLALC